jgi:tRNA-dihydrouridine synthase
MRIYLAPLEGITNSIYRTALHKHFGGVDRYFTPFITPSAKGVLGEKILRDVLPENNEGQEVIPQILTNSADGFIAMCKRLSDFGYTEFNLNLGCPSGTVVSKNRGSGFLAFPDELDRFLDEIFKSDYKISVKTRIGKESPEEFYRLLEIYNQYPMTELIIHPRTRTDMYKNHPNLDMYRYATKNSKNKLCYNGDIFDMRYYKTFTAEFPEADTIMIGRGAIINPALPALIKGKAEPTSSELKAFFFTLYEEYVRVLYGNTQLLHKMKEVMGYMLFAFENSEKTGKKIKKAKNVNDFKVAVNELFDTCRLKNMNC